MANYEKLANFVVDTTKNNGDWTLKDDIELKDSLKTCSDGILKSLDVLNSTNYDLERKMSEMEVRLSHIHDRIGFAKAEQFIEEKVDDITEIILAQKREPQEKVKKEISQKEYEERTIRAISYAAMKGFELLGTMNADGGGRSTQSDPIDPNTSAASELGVTQQQPTLKLLANIVSNLPPVIGTKEFNALMEARKRVDKEGQMKMQKPIDSGPERAERTSPSQAALTTSKEEDLVSTSSNRSVPPQDPIVTTTTTSEKANGLKNALLEEVISKMAASSNQKTGREAPKAYMEEGSSQSIGGKKADEDEQNTSKAPPNKPLLPMPEAFQSKSIIASPVSLPEPSKTIQTVLTVQQAEKPSSEVPKMQTAQSQSQAAMQPPTKSLPPSKTKPRRRMVSNRKSLFSSTSSEDEEEEGNGPAATTQKPSSSIWRGTTGLKAGRKAEDDNLERPQAGKPAESGQLAASEEEIMSRPVFKPFDSAFSDRLAAALQSGPVALRPDRVPVRRPLSAQSIPSNGEDDANGPRPLRKTESEVSSNDELGPATVRARIAQIGAKIPLARGQREEEGGKAMGNGQEGEGAKAPMPTQQTEALKTRAKGPARRAPTNLANKAPQSKPQSQSGRPPLPGTPSKSAIDVEKPVKTTTTHQQPPPVAPKQKSHHSIFSSSSSEDDLARLVSSNSRSRTVPAKSQPPLPPSKAAPPQAVAKRNEPKQRKGLFDDSDSDF